MGKLFLFLALLLLPVRAFPQIKLATEKDSTAIPYAHIFLDDVFYTHSDETGAFTIDAKEKYDTLKVAHLSYETRLFSAAAIKNVTIIALAEKENLLEELAITAKKRRQKKQMLLPAKSNGSFSGKRDLLLLDDWGGTYGRDENSDEVNISKAVYIPNDGHKDAPITKIILSSVDKEVKGDTEYIPFRVNLMTYDTIRHLPGEKIFKEDFTVGKTKGQTVIIDLEDYGILTLPREGICIVVSVYHTKYYANNSLHPPKFEAARINKSSGYREYVFGLNQNISWEEQYYSQVREQCFNWGVEIERVE